MAIRIGSIGLILGRATLPGHLAHPFLETHIPAAAQGMTADVVIIVETADRSVRIGSRGGIVQRRIGIGCERFRLGYAGWSRTYTPDWYRLAASCRQLVFGENLLCIHTC